MRLPFGKYRGWPLADVPDDYLGWLRGLPDLREPLRAAVAAEWELRFVTPALPVLPTLPSEARPIAEELIAVGYRALARQHHPDQGGETRTMQLVNDAVTWLREAVRAA